MVSSARVEMSSYSTSLPRNLNGKENKNATVHAMRTWGGGRSTTPLILNVGTRRRVINCTTPPLYPLKKTAVPIARCL